MAILVLFHNFANNWHILGKTRLGKLTMENFINGVLTLGKFTWVYLKSDKRIQIQILFTKDISSEYKYEEYS